MAENIKRVKQQVFASNSGNNGTTIYGSPAQGDTQYSTDVKDLMSSEAWLRGKSAGFVAGKCPVWTDDNAIEYVITKQLAYLMQKGIPEWDIETTYFKGNICLVIGTTGEPSMYYSLTDENISNNPLSDTANWKALSLGGGGGYLGQITFGLRSDTPAGQLRMDGTIYSADEYQSFIDLFIKTNKIPSKTMSEYEAELATNSGNCGIFGYDINGDSLRVPCVKDGVYIMQVLTTGIGSFTDAGVPNIIGSADLGSSVLTAKGAFSANPLATKRNAVETTNFDGGFLFNASLSNPIYGNSDTVQTNAISYPLFICVSNEVEEQVSVIEDYQVYNTVPLGCPVFSDNRNEDANYLLSNNQWNDGSLYTAMYNLLLEQYDNVLSEDVTKTIGNYTITYKKTPLGYLITTDVTNADLIFSESNVTFWIIDTAGSRFKLPRNNKRTLVERAKVGENGWYEVYSDGWCRQGGISNNVPASSTATINFLKSFKNSEYNVVSLLENTAAGFWILTNKSSDSVIIKNNNVSAVMFLGWIAEGYTTIDENVYDPNRYLYYKVGNTTVNADLVNLSRLEGSKADINLSNITAEARHKSFVEQTIDLANKIPQIWNTYYIAEEDGYIYVWGNGDGSTGTTVEINGNLIKQMLVGNANVGILYRIIKGDKYRAFGSGGTPAIVFYKLRTI